MATPRTSRRESRQRIDAEILAAARRQLAEVGGAGLSLRSVAREVGMVSSAVYRYVASRDELLTRLIIESYDSLGSVVERSVTRTMGDPALDRWVAAAGAIRRWARQHPHEYLLLYGTPVPGYAAPEDTVLPGTRVILALATIVGDAEVAGHLEVPGGGKIDLSPALSADLRALAAAGRFEVSPGHVVAFLAAWTQLFGLVGFELTNQTRNMVGDSAALFTAATTQLGHHMGLRHGRGS